MALRDLLHRVFYRLVVGFLKLILHAGARVRVAKYGAIPEGACVMVSNHISHFDPPLLSGWLPRKIDWIAMAELFSARWSKAAFTWLDVIPVDRHGDDRTALRQALKRLAEGCLVGVFPEGGIRDGERSILSGAEMREGAFLIAAKAGCPVLPVVILGSDKLYNQRRWLRWSRADIDIGIGDPIFPNSSGGRKQLRDDTASAIVAIKERLIADRGLEANDLPRPPRERMLEP